MCPLVLAKITTIRARKLAESTLMRFLPLMQSADMRLQLRMRRGRISAAIAHIRSLACVRSLVIVFRLIRGERLVAPNVAACVWPIACMSQQMP
jgi:hypothetical protein